MPVALLAELQVMGVEAFKEAMHAAERVVTEVAGIIDAGFKAMENAFVKFVESAIQEAIKIDKVRSTIAGLYDSIAIGEQKIANTRLFSRKSNLSADSLLENMATAEMGGINFDAIRKTIDVLSRGNEERARQITEALVRAGTGANLAVVMRALQRTGIGYDDLRAQGIKVSAGHHIEATGEEFLQGIIDIAKRKFPQLAEYLSKSMSTAMIDLKDSWDIMTEAFGRAWFPLIRSILTPLAQFINFLADTGKAQALGEALSKAFGTLFNNAGGQSAFVSFLMFVFTSMEMLPQIIKSIGTVMINAIKIIGDVFIAEINMFLPLITTIVNFVRISLGGVLLGLGTIMSTVTGRPMRPEVAANLNGLMVPLDTPVPFTSVGNMVGRMLETLGSGLGNSPGEFGKLFKKNMSDFDAYLKEPPKTATESKEIFNKIHTGVEAEKQTARNTEKMAAHMDKFARFVIGGGDRGKYGIAPSEFYGHAGIGSGSVRFDGGPANSHLRRGIHEMIGQAVQSLRRNKYATH